MYYVTKEPMTLAEAHDVLEQAGYRLLNYGDVLLIAIDAKRNRFFLDDSKIFKSIPCGDGRRRVFGESLHYQVDDMVALLDMVSEEDPEFGDIVPGGIDAMWPDPPGWPKVKSRT